MRSADLQPESPLLSVIVPVRDGGPPFKAVLKALLACPGPERELIVVDDGSTDASPLAARASGVRLLSTKGGEGPGAARNLGAAHARGRWLLFVDADCVPHPDTLQRLADWIFATPDATALFGSYDDAPAADGFVSQYKNLVHHFVHQRSAIEAFTFWAGCGAVRREAFSAVGGFDAVGYPRPSIEDIELGYRLRARGLRIVLAKDVQVTHHKRWTLLSMIRTDIRDRAIPWARLNAARRVVAADLNLRWHHRISGVLVWGLVGGLLASVGTPTGLPLAFGCGAALTVANLDLYAFLASRRGPPFALRAVPLHWLYYFYASASFVLGSALGLLDRRRSRH